MNKELFVSATPHETKVGITEDDQLAEIYLERENEYTLAGSIYKGRVTRVLPGMQSAFVDIGLERDAFLYVSDFMDLEQQDEDLDEEIPANRPILNGRGEGQARRDEAVPSNSEAPAAEQGFEEAGSIAAAAAEPANGESREGGREFRGRRRRRGRRENGDRGGRSGGERSSGDRSESRESRGGESRSEGERMERPRGFEVRGTPGRYQRPAPTGRTGRDYDYGPPPGYQPIILPGESISKYRQAPTAAASAAEQAADAMSEVAIATSFPEDEPMFTSTATEPLHEEHDAAAQPEAYEHSGTYEETHEEDGHQDEPSASLNAVPATAEMRTESHFDTTQSDDQAGLAVVRGGHEMAHESDFASALAHDTGRVEEFEETTEEETTEEEAMEVHEVKRVVSPDENVEEQEIEEEEAELAAYGEELGDDDGFEEIEEETRAAGGEVIASSLSEPGVPPVEGAELGEHAETSEAALEAEEREAEELELEEAQAEAEALLEAEAIGDGTVDASAEVRAAAPEARMQRPQRRFERGGDPARRGGRRGGGSRRRFRSRENTVVPQISELLKEGQEILVQIAKEPIGKKGARITSHIALPGRFLVFMPTVNHTGVSRKISSEEERQRLKRIIQSERENGAGGFIVRTAAAGASDDELRADIRFLKNLWNEIKTRSENSKSPALIYHDLNVVERVLRDQVSSDFSVIWVDTETEYERILRFANRFQPGLVKRVKLYTKETPLFEQFGLNEEINKALKSKVWLKSGGYIVINQTEALVAIDVNTGKYVGKTSRLEDTIVKTNVDAIREIVRQVRLRDLGGIIIIDFIDMDERRNRQKVMQALEEALRSDRAPSKVLQFNDFGLVAITRKRVKQSLERTIGSPCPYCQATGFVKAVNTVCNEIYVEMRKISQHLEHNDVMLRVNPEVAKVLKTNNAKLLNEMEELTKKTIIIKSDPALHQEQFDIH
jgi:ribonuclease G